MANGIAGDTGFPSLSGTFDENLMTVELRVISNLLQSLLGNGTGGANNDELRVLRNDQAFELGMPLPVAGN